MPLTDSERNKLKDDISEAVAEGLRRALEDPEFWSRAVGGMQKQATVATGNWVMAMFKKGLSKAFWSFAVLAAVYSVGGWPALTKLFVVITGKP